MNSKVNSRSVSAFSATSSIRTPEKGCVVCAFKLVTILYTLVGISPLRGFCPHRDDTSKTYFEVSGFGMTISFLIFGTCAVAAAYNIFDVIDADYSQNKLDIIYNVNDTLFILISALATLMPLFQIKTKVKEYTGLLSLLEHQEMFCVQNVFNHRSERLIFWISVGTTVLIAITSSSFSIFAAYVGILTRKNIKNILQHAFSSLTTLVVLFLLQQLLLNCIIYNIMFRGLHGHLKKFMEPYRKSLETDDSAPVMSRLVDVVHMKKEGFQDGTPMDSVPLVVKISKLRRMYAAILLNIRVLNDFYNPTILILVSFVLISMIINIYLVIMSKFEDRLNNPLNAHYYYKIIGSLVCLVAFFQTADMLKSAAQSASSYLYSYPISGLESQEAGEIEMYLEMMNTQKPSISASGVFNVGTSLFASISGTVVTYVLVALQFNIDWANDVSFKPTNSSTI